MNDGTGIDRTERGPRRGRVRTCTLALLAVAGGIAMGTHWHSTFERLVGRGRGAEADQHEAPAAGGARVLWTCSMDPQVIREQPGPCPICHMQLTPLKVPAPDTGAAHGPEHAAGAQGTGKQRKVKYWWDPMLSPPYIADKPGKSPMGMDLIPVYEDEAPAAGSEVIIDPAVVQNMGVRVATVTEGPLSRIVRLVGYLDEAQPNIHDVNLRVSGWVRRLHVSTEGQNVAAGDPLFDLYSPELQVAVEELLSAGRAQSALPGDADPTARQVAGTLRLAAARKLELFGLERAQIDALAKLDQAPDAVTFTSPVTGHVTEKPIVEGAAVKMGDRVLRIVDHSTLWLNAQVFEQDLPFIAIGQTATAGIASRPGDLIEGQIIFIHPHVDMRTRTAMVRLAIPNASMTLKPGMYATVRVQSRITEHALMVPREAIIDTGDSQLAFVAKAAGRFEPRRIRMGLAGADGMVQVLDGLAAGESVVTSGQFLLDSESRRREAIQKFLDETLQRSRREGAGK